MLRYRSMIVLTCIVVLVLHGCSRHKSVSVNPDARQAKRVYKSSSPAALSEYIRTVLKISQENTASAEAVLTRLHERRPELAELARRASEDARDLASRKSLAAVYMEEGLYTFAFQLFQEIQVVAPRDSFAELGIARIWNEWNDNSLALQHAQLAVAYDPNSVEAFEVLGRIHLQRNELDSAVSAFLSGLQVGGENASLLANAGYAFMARGNLKQAWMYLERAVELDGTIVEAHNNLGIVLAQLNDQEGALREFLAVNEPAAAFNNLGVAYLAQKRWKEARDAFKQSLALNADYEKARVNLAEAESHIPLPTVVDVAFKDEPTDAVNQNAEASRPRRVKEVKKSAADTTMSRKQTTIQPARSPVSTKNGRLMIAYKDALERFNRRRYSQAGDILEWILQQNPDDALASRCDYWLGEVYFATGRYADAMAAFRRVAAYSSPLKKHDAMVMLKRARLKQQQKGKV
ncbi:MAG TPA: tetratricopeptide repeat protein [Blastocatellia bacterium]|nr:tetratricopeptide repeat protein [Blastocatellia bacterium]